MSTPGKNCDCNCKTSQWLDPLDQKRGLENFSKFFLPMLPQEDQDEEKRICLGENWDAEIPKHENVFTKFEEKDMQIAKAPIPYEEENDSDEFFLSHEGVINTSTLNSNQLDTLYEKYLRNEYIKKIEVIFQQIGYIKICHVNRLKSKRTRRNGNFDFMQATA